MQRSGFAQCLPTGAAADQGLAGNKGKGDRKSPQGLIRIMKKECPGSRVKLDKAEREALLDTTSRQIPKGYPGLVDPSEGGGSTRPLVRWAQGQLVEAH